MAQKPTYWELLQHPKWQEKRLRVLQLAQFSCENCGAEDKTLHVHHSYYERGLNPWDYPDQSLHSLCVDCHAKAQDQMTLLHRAVGRLGLADTAVLLGYAMALDSQTFPATVIDVYSAEIVTGVAQAFELTERDVINALRDGVVDGYTLTELRDATKGGSR